MTSWVFTIAVLAIPLELPAFLVGALVLVASVPLWQRIDESLVQQGETTADSLDGIWLLIQLLQGNPLAGALSLHLSEIGGRLRSQKSDQLEQELAILFEAEDEAISGQGVHQPLAILPTTVRQWTQSLTVTDSLQPIDAIAKSALPPTLALSGGIGLLTGDLNRASTVLSLDMGATLRGTTPLAIVAALITAVRQGVYIRDGRTLEKLAQVDTLVMSLDAYRLLLGDRPYDRSSLSVNIYLLVPDEQYLPTHQADLPPVYVIPDRSALEELFEWLRHQGHCLAWLEDDFATLQSDRADVKMAIATQESVRDAQVLIHRLDLNAIEGTFALARHTVANVYESLAIALVPHLIAIMVGIIFGLDPIITVSINGGTEILAELYSSRLPTEKSSRHPLKSFNKKTTVITNIAKPIKQE